MKGKGARRARPGAGSLTGVRLTGAPAARSIAAMNLHTWLIYFAAALGLFAAIEIATELFIASMAHRISPWLRRVGRRFNQACGGVFMAIGLALPLRG
jgi:threonine/homoserine/homoserine lactone efflux protein